MSRTLAVKRPCLSLSAFSVARRTARRLRCACSRRAHKINTTGRCRGRLGGSVDPTAAPHLAMTPAGAPAGWGAGPAPSADRGPRASCTHCGVGEAREGGAVQARGSPWDCARAWAAQGEACHPKGRRRRSERRGRLGNGDEWPCPQHHRGPGAQKASGRRCLNSRACRPKRLQTDGSYADAWHRRPCRGESCLRD